MSTNARVVMAMGVMLVSGAVAFAQAPQAGGQEKLLSGATPVGSQQEMRSAGMRPGGTGMRSGMGQPGGAGRMGAMMNPERRKAAGATEDQIKAISAIQAESEKEFITLKANAEMAQLKMREQLKADTVDKKAVMDAADAMIAAQGAMMKAGIMNQLKVREILGAELTKKLSEQRPTMRPSGMNRSTEGGEKGQAPVPPAPVTAPAAAPAIL